MTSHATQTRMARDVQGAAQDVVPLPRCRPSPCDQPPSRARRHDAPTRALTRGTAMSDDTSTRRADTDQRLTDLAGREHLPWKVAQSPAGVPFYAVAQGRFWARVVAAMTETEAVAYLTAKPTAAENPFQPTNVLARADGDAVTCLKAATSYAFTVRANRDLTPDHFDNADKGLRTFVARVVAAVKETA